MLPSNPAWSSGVHRGGRCWVTQGSCFLFPPFFAAKVHQFFPSFLRDTFSISTKTTVPWACARLFAGTRRWLWDAMGVGMATDDLIFPSGTVKQSDGEMEQGDGMSPTSRGQGHVAVQVPDPRTCRVCVNRVLLHHVRTGAVLGWLKVAEPPLRCTQGARRELQVHLWP